MLKELKACFLSDTKQRLKRLMLPGWLYMPRVVGMQTGIMSTDWFQTKTTKRTQN